MQDVNIYIETSFHGPARKDGEYLYLLECIRNGVPATREGRGAMEPLSWNWRKRSGSDNTSPFEGIRTNQRPQAGFGMATTFASSVPSKTCPGKEGENFPKGDLGAHRCLDGVL